MRTTVTLDDDVAAKIKELAHQRRSSFKATLNDVLRKGLTSPEARGHTEHFVVEPHSGGFRPGIDPDKLNQLLDELEIEAFIAESGSSE